MSCIRMLVTGVAVVVSAWLAPLPSHADGAAKVADRWLEWLDADPLAISAFAARQGDDAVLSRLSAQTDPAVCLVAIAAAPFMRSPELALLPLARLAIGRDPDLSEAAARQAREIAQALALEGLARREILPATLAPARAALDVVAQAKTVRADLRRLAAEASFLLGSVAVPR